MNINPEKHPLVGICIPTYNRISSLKRCVESALSQDYPNIEIIVSDNCSEDGTKIYIQSLLNHHSNITYTRNHENIGSSPNFNQVRKKSEARYIMWLADDDWISNDYVSSCMRTLLKDPAILLASGTAVHVDHTNETQGTTLSITNNCRLLRFLNYYFSINDNSLFYGIIDQQSAELIDLEDKSGNDCHFIAAIAYQGKLVTLENTFVYRSVAGVSSSMGNAAKAWGEPWWVQREPYLGMAVGAYKSMIQNNSIYGETNIIARHFTGLIACSWIITKKIFARRLYRLMLKLINMVKQQ